MTHDTSKDPRILVAQRACTLLKHVLQQRSGVKLLASRDRMTEMAAGLESNVMALMYTYQEPTDLAESDLMLDLAAQAEDLASILEPALSSDTTPPLIKAGYKWCLRTLIGLPERLANPGKTMSSGVDILAVEVRNVTTIGKKLWLTRVNDRKNDYTVITNMPGLGVGDVLAVAFLPPREVGGAVSEAMYLGDERRQEPAGTILTEDQVDGREAAGILHDEISRR